MRDRRSTVPSIGAAESAAPMGVYALLATSPNGLTWPEAEERLRHFGPNTIRDVEATPLYRKLLANLTHVMALLLWAGGLVGFIAQLPQLGIAIWMVNLINGGFSFWQEYRAEKATEALRRMLPIYARVLRDGQEIRIRAEELVPGDVVLVAEGNRVSADARLVEAVELRVGQSALTGESDPVFKTSDALDPGVAIAAEKTNLIFAGTSVTSGEGRAVVLATGMNTEFGQIARLTQSIGEQPSPLQREMARVTKAVTGLAVSIGLAFFVLAVLFARVDPPVGFIFAMGMIVAFVPEGMLPTVTLSLAMGVQRMAKHNALVKRLSAVETLGSASVICTDKTGTLTQNEMTVREIWLPGRYFSVSGSGYALDGYIVERGVVIPSPADGDLRQLLLAASLCTTARLVRAATGPTIGDHAPSRWTVEGDPTEAALQIAALKAGIDVEAEARRSPRLREVPFEASRRRMSSLHAVDREARPDGLIPSTRGPSVLYVKGSPHEVLDACTHIRAEGAEWPLDSVRRAEILEVNDEYAAQGLRVLAVALRDGLAAPPPGPIRSERAPQEMERDLTFLGLVAMMDPPRPEVAAAVQKCHRAGIRIVMITGDYGLTAETIARRIGILGESGVRVLTGSDIDAMDDQSLQHALEGEAIVARAAPAHKVRVVAALQASGHIVAVTGDGVNDAPALKRADIGIAMGRAGTDVAREAADMILADDNFASIVNAIEEGRAVFANIRRFALYVFNSNVAEAVPFVLMLFSRGGIPLPLTVMQVLAIDLGTDMVPAIGLGAEQPEADVMDRPPRSQREPLLSGPILARALFWYGALESMASMSAYFFLNWLHGWPGIPLAGEGTEIYRMATTMTLAGVVATQVGAVFGCRTDRASVFRIGFFTNRLVVLGIAAELILLALLVYVPFLHGIFNTAPIGLAEWAFVAAWTPTIFLVDEARKFWLRRKGAVSRLSRPPGEKAA